MFVSFVSLQSLNYSGLTHIVYQLSSMSSQGQAGNPTAMPPKSMTTNIMEPNEPAPLAPPSADPAGQPVSAGPLRDQAIFQHVVGVNSRLSDAAAAGDSLEISGDESDDSNPDSKDGNSINGSHIHRYLIDTPDLSNNTNTIQRAISLQVSKRLQHDLPKVLPIPHGISSILDTRIAIDTDEPVVTEGRDVLMKLSDQLWLQVKHPPKNVSMNPILTVEVQESLYKSFIRGYVANDGGRGSNFCVSRIKSSSKGVGGVD